MTITELQTQILVAVAEDGSFQIVDVVSSYEEAIEMADNYIKYGPENDWLAPYAFQIHERGMGGAFVEVTEFDIPYIRASVAA